MSTPETQAYWEAAEQERLLLKQCGTCGSTHYPPRSHCPLCFAEHTDWVQASGRAEVYSFSVANRAAPPYVVAYVRLEEGPMMLTNITGCPPSEVRVGQPVQVTFTRDAEGRMRPYFTPVAGGM